MHEMAIAKRLVAEALERMDGERGDRLTEVEIVLGASAGLSPESVRQHFALAAQGTPAEGAVVHFTYEPSRYWCFDCMFEFSSRLHRDGACPRCGGSVVSIDREQLVYVRTVDGSAAVRGAAAGPGS